MSVARVPRFALHDNVMRHVTILRTMLAAIAMTTGGSVPVAWAQDASGWDGALHAAVRLIAGAAINSAGMKLLQAGIEIRLDPGWKTYWRYPGDSGLPPTFDFAGSENVKSATVLWPAPQRFADGASGHSIGYLGDVVLPLRIVAKDASKPSVLRIKLRYEVCGNLCVPAQADLALALSGKAGADESILAAAERRVPRRIPLGANSAPAGALAVRSIEREADGAHARVAVEVAAPEGTPVDLFAEGPTPDWALPLPEQTKPLPGDAPGVRRFTFDLDGLPPGARAAGATLTLTAVSPNDAIEVEAHLD